MNLDEFDLKDLLLTALKSEIDSKNIYGALSKKIKNYLLKDKLEFLVKEEEKHRKFIEEIYLNHYPNEKIIIPDKTVAPLPETPLDSLRCGVAAPPACVEAGEARCRGY